jgi:hypothetical protein
MSAAAAVRDGQDIVSDGQAALRKDKNAAPPAQTSAVSAATAAAPPCPSTYAVTHLVPGPSGKGHPLSLHILAGLRKPLLPCLHRGNSAAASSDAPWALRGRRHQGACPSLHFAWPALPPRATQRNSGLSTENSAPLPEPAPNCTTAPPPPKAHLEGLHRCLPAPRAHDARQRLPSGLRVGQPLPLDQAAPLLLRPVRDDAIHLEAGPGRPQGPGRVPRSAGPAPGARAGHCWACTALVLPTACPPAGTAPTGAPPCAAPCQ